MKLTKVAKIISLTALALCVVAACVILAVRFKPHDAKPSEGSIRPYHAPKEAEYYNHRLTDQFRMTIKPGGCPAVAGDLKQRVLTQYAKFFRGITHVNIFGDYEQREDNGAYAVWSGQWKALEALGIRVMMICRSIDECDMADFRARLEAHRPHSAIVWTGGGNLIDYHWRDTPSRLKMVRMFPDFPIRAFPQAMNGATPERTAEVVAAFRGHPNALLAARDALSYDWLLTHFPAGMATEIELIPDVAAMWWEPKELKSVEPKVGVLIVARDDAPLEPKAMGVLPHGHGTLDVGDAVEHPYWWTYPQNHRRDFAYWPEIWLNYTKISSTEWLNSGPAPLPSHTKRGAGSPAPSHNITDLAFARTRAQLDTLATARFVVTDDLYVHILAVVLGKEHVLMGRRWSKTLAFRSTWTLDCACYRRVLSWWQARHAAYLIFYPPVKADAHPQLPLVWGPSGGRAVVKAP